MAERYVQPAPEPAATAGSKLTLRATHGDNENLAARVRAVAAAAWRGLPRGDTLPADSWRRRHRALTALLALHAVALPLASLQQSHSPLHSLLHALPLLAFAAAAASGRVPRKGRAVLVSLGLLTSSALLVHIAQGSIEAHFHFFVMIALIALYEEWLPFLLAFAYVVVHHGAGGAVAAASVYNHPDAQAHPWRWAAIHGAFVVAAGAANVVAWRLNENARAERLVESERRAFLSEERYRSIVETTREWVWETNVDGVITYSNTAGAAILGYAPDALVGKSVAELVHPDDVRRLRAAMRDPGAASTGWSGLVLRWRRADGSYCSLERQGSAVVTDDGRIVFRGTDRDVSDRVAAERERERLLRRTRKQQQFVEAILDTVGIVVVVDRDGRIVRFNRAAEELTGYTFSEVEGKRGDMFLPPDERPTVEARVSGASSEAASVGENHWIARDGRRHLLAWTNKPIRDANGDVDFVVSSAVDITDRERAERDRQHLEEQLLASQRAEALGRLAGGIAHDFNNLLLAISGYSALLAEDVADRARARDYADEIVKATDRAANLTRQLLAYSRKQILSPKVLDLNSIVADLGTMLPRVIGEDVVLVTELADDLAAVTADQGQVEQVVMNLAVNARDAMPGGGVLKIKTSNVVVGEHGAAGDDVPPGRYVRLALSDTGCGIDAETRKQLFEPFFTTKEVGKGTGLGLATVDGIVKQSGGHVVVDSEVGSGSTFAVYLPAVAATHALEAEAPAAVPVEGSETILLVEDDAVVRGLARAVLERSGYRVLEAGDGAAALEASAAHDGSIALLLTDVVMPVLGGIEVAKRLARTRPDMEVLYMSGYPEAMPEDGSRVPAANFIQKPFPLDDLRAKVRSVLDGTRLRAADRAA